MKRLAAHPAILFIAIGASWALSSLWPVTILALIVAAGSVRRYFLKRRVSEDIAQKLGSEIESMVPEFGRPRTGAQLFGLFGSKLWLDLLADSYLRRLKALTDSLPQGFNTPIDAPSLVRLPRRLRDVIVSTETPIEMTLEQAEARLDDLASIAQWISEKPSLPSSLVRLARKAFREGKEQVKAGLRAAGGQSAAAQYDEMNRIYRQGVTLAHIFGAPELYWSGRLQIPALQYRMTAGEWPQRLGLEKWERLRHVVFGWPHG